MAKGVFFDLSFVDVPLHPMKYGQRSHRRNRALINFVRTRARGAHYSRNIILHDQDFVVSTIYDTVSAKEVSTFTQRYACVRAEAKPYGSAACKFVTRCCY